MKTIFFLAAMFLGFCMLNTLQAQVTQTFIITNKTGSPVTAVSISPTGANSWSDNLMQTEKIENGYSFKFEQAVDKNNCTYDIRYTGSDGKDYYVKGVSLCTSSVVTLQRDKTKTEK